MMRELPKMRDHRRLGLSYVSFRLGDRRRVLYLGPIGSAKARARYRVFARHWPDRLGLVMPFGGRWSTPRSITYDGRTQTMAKWAAEFGVKATTIRWRLDLGWDIERALTTPAKQTA